MPPDETQAWLRRARDDLRMAEVILASNDPISHGAAFHAQQAAEKALKALLVAHGRKPPRTHNLGHLLTLAEEVGVSLDHHLDAAASLTDHAVEARYPGPPTITEDEAREAIRNANTIVHDILDHLP